MVALPYLANRRLSNDEIAEAFGLIGADGRASSTFYERLKAGTLVADASALIRAGRHLGVNPMRLLVEYDHLRTLEIVEFVQENLGLLPPHAERQLHVWRTLLDPPAPIERPASDGWPASWRLLGEDAPARDP